MYQTAMTGTARPIVVLGASYAAGWRVTDIGGVPVQNAGVTGQQSFEMLARFDRDVAAVRPRAVVLWGFINDIFRADDVDRALIRIRESYTEMISRARAEQIQPVLATEVTIRPPKTVVETLMATLGWVMGKESYQDRVNGHVVTVNAWLRELGQREGLLVLDLQRTLASGPDGPRRWSYAADDGSHISEEGYRVVTEYAVPRLVQHLNLAAAGTSGRR
jgi:lysophospholipase L1-like esterase